MPPANDDSTRVIPDGWGEHRLLVLHEISRLDCNQKTLQKNQGNLETRLSTLQVRMMIWGGIGGAVGTAAMAGIVALIVKGHVQ